MHCVKKIQDDLFWIGDSDRRLALCEEVITARAAWPTTPMSS